MLWVQLAAEQDLDLGVGREIGGAVAGGRCAGQLKPEARHPRVIAGGVEARQIVEGAVEGLSFSQGLLPLSAGDFRCLAPIKQAGDTPEKVGSEGAGQGMGVFFGGSGLDSRGDICLDGEGGGMKVGVDL